MYMHVSFSEPVDAGLVEVSVALGVRVDTLAKYLLAQALTDHYSELLEFRTRSGLWKGRRRVEREHKDVLGSRQIELIKQRS